MKVKRCIWWKCLLLYIYNVVCFNNDQLFIFFVCKSTSKCRIYQSFFSVNSYFSKQKKRDYKCLIVCAIAVCRRTASSTCLRNIWGRECWIGKGWLHSKQPEQRIDSGCTITDKNSWSVYTKVNDNKILLRTQRLYLSFNFNALWKNNTHKQNKANERKIHLFCFCVATFMKHI